MRSAAPRPPRRWRVTGDGLELLAGEVPVVGVPSWPQPQLRGFGGEPFWLHPYTLADAEAWRGLARSLSSKPDDEPAWLSFAQMLHVCRAGPEPDAPSLFDLPASPQAALRAAAGRLRQHLPGRFVEWVCRESDALSMDGYLPDEEAVASEEATERLGELLATARWRYLLGRLVRQVWGETLETCGRRPGEVLTMLQEDRRRQRQLAEALGPVAAMLGGGGDGG